MNAHGWWWHLFHDPMRNNLWSLVGLGVVLILGGIALVALAAVDQHRIADRIAPRRKKD